MVVKISTYQPTFDFGSVIRPGFFSVSKLSSELKLLKKTCWSPEIGKGIFTKSLNWTQSGMNTQSTKIGSFFWVLDKKTNIVYLVFLKIGQYIQKNEFQRTNHPTKASQIWWIYKTNKFIGPATTVRWLEKI